MTTHTLRAFSLTPAALLAGALLAACGGGGGTTCTDPFRLDTTYDGGNGNDGIAFDVRALRAIEVYSLDANLSGAGTYDVDVYHRAGTWVDHTAAEDWVLLATVEVTSAGAGTGTEIPLPAPVRMGAGSRHAFFITSPDAMDYTDGTAVGTVAASDSNLEVYEGGGISGMFEEIFTPRIFNGTVYYQTCH